MSLVSLPKRKGFMSLTAVTRAYGLTARAVRHYEALGLVDSIRDRSNRRLFDGVAVWRLELIAQFRLAGLGLEDIREILDRFDDPNATSSLPLGYASAKLTARLKTLDRERGQVERMLDQLAALSEAAAGHRARQGGRGLQASN